MQPAAGYLAATDAGGSYESAQVTFSGNPQVGFASTMDTVYEGNPLALWMTSSKYFAGTPLLVNYSIGGTAVNGYDYVDSGANLDNFFVGDGPLSGTVDLDVEKYYLGPSVGHGIVIFANALGLTSGTKTIQITLLPGVGYTLDPAHATETVTLVENNSYNPPPTPEIGISNATAVAGDDLVFTLTPRTRPSRRRFKRLSAFHRQLAGRV